MDTDAISFRLDRAAADAEERLITALADYFYERDFGMPMIDKLRATTEPVFVDAMQAAAGNPLAVPRGLLRTMAAAGVTAPGDVDKLSEAQLAKVLENKTPEQRMELKSHIMRANLYPRMLPNFSRIR